MDIKLEPQLQAKLQQHWQQVREANTRFNLTAITDEEEARSKHYDDCLQLLPSLELLADAANVLDLGSGAGFPGLVLATACPRLRFTLLDATAKKCDFLQSCGQKLGLANLAVLCSRAEEAGRDPLYREAFDAVTARAVASLRELIELAFPLLKIGGRLLAMKGAAYEEELGASANALAVLGGRVEKIRSYSLNGGDKRVVVEIVKQLPTDARFPRRPGICHKRPL